MIYLDTNIIIYVIEKNQKYEEACKKILKDIKLNKFEVASSIHLLVELVIHLNKLNKLLLDQKERSIKIEKYSGEEESVKLDNKDKKIINLLSQQSNLSILDIAEKAKLTIDVVKYRLKKLSGDIIISYRALFNLNKIGYHHYVLMLKMRKASKKDEDDLIDWCTSKKNVLYCSKRIGSFDVEINMAIGNIEDLNSFMDEFKDKFSNLVDSYELIINSKLLKLNYVPF